MSYLDFDFPHTRFFESDLRELIKQVFIMNDLVTNFVSINAIKYADPIQWNITKSYEKNTVVIDGNSGVAYISVRPVPAGVALTREQYWTKVFDLSVFITKGAANFANTYESEPTTTATQTTQEGNWIVWDTTLYQALNTIHPGDRYIPGGNIKRMTVEDFYNILKSIIDNEVHEREAGDDALEIALNEETELRSEGDVALHTEIETATSALHTEIVNESVERENADNILDGKISQEIEDRTAADAELTQRIDRIDSSIMPLDVTAHGVIGDGNTINDDAFATLLTDFPNYTYYFPKGVYRFRGTAFSGNIQLIGDGDAIIIGFNYTDLSFPNTNVESIFDIDQAFFSAKNIKFKGESNNYGLTIHVQSQGSVLRTFDISDCVFYGTYGLRCINCITGNISSCDFIKNIIGILFESSTNMTICECNWYSPIIGIKIGTSGDDTAGRHGGESIMLTACQMIDGVTGIFAQRHNYLELTNCMFDYFNCCIWLDASRFARIINTYLGYHEGNKSAALGYIAPPQYGALWGYSSVSGIPFSVECINSEFVGYGDTTHIPVVLNGTGLTTGEDLDFVACRFSVISSSRANTLLYITKCSDVYLNGNRFYAPSNNNLEQPFVISESARVINSSNDYANCFNTQSVTIQPTMANRQNNNTYQEAIEVHKNADNSTLISIPITFNAQYDSAPKVVATMMGGADYYKCICSVTGLSRTGCTLNIYNPSGTLSGEYYANVLVMHAIY